MRLFLRSIGSLWFAAVLLMLLLVAMACATIYETTHGTKQAAEAFYHNWWFKVLLCLLGVNVLASVLVRYPFSHRQIGFILTHTGILITLWGAQVTHTLGTDGQVAIAEGQSVTALCVAFETLTVHNRQNNGHLYGGVDIAIVVLCGIVYSLRSGSRKRLRAAGYGRQATGLCPKTRSPDRRTLTM